MPYQKSAQFGVDAKTVAILVAGSDEYHHQVDVCTAATTIFAGADTETYVLMNNKKEELINWRGQDVSKNCVVTGDATFGEFEKAVAKATED